MYMYTTYSILYYLVAALEGGQGARGAVRDDVAAKAVDIQRGADLVGFRV